jgi:hypothetical protein
MISSCVASSGRLRRSNLTTPSHGKLHVQAGLGPVGRVHHPHRVAEVDDDRLLALVDHIEDRCDQEEGRTAPMRP